jgi:phosphoribosylaminoimidazole (AIR) synthetase
MGTGFLVMVPKSDERETLRTIKGSRVVGKVVQERKVIVETATRKLEIERW